MRQATVRDLRYRFPEIEPEQPAPPPQFPDFMAWLKRIHGDKVLKVTGAQLIREERDAGY